MPVDVCGEIANRLPDVTNSERLTPRNGALSVLLDVLDRGMDHKGTDCMVLTLGLLADRCGFFFRAADCDHYSFGWAARVH